jgi:hypothetical protein
VGKVDSKIRITRQHGHVIELNFNTSVSGFFHASTQYFADNMAQEINNLYLTDAPVMVSE